jgi:hypothetical protein
VGAAEGVAAAPLDGDVAEVVDVDAGWALPCVAAMATVAVPAPSPPARTAVIAALRSSVPLANVMAASPFRRAAIGSQCMKNRRGNWRQAGAALKAPSGFDAALCGPSAPYSGPATARASASGYLDQRKVPLIAGRCGVIVTDDPVFGMVVSCRCT